MSDGETMPVAIMPEAPGSAPALPEEALRIAAGYAFGGPALDPGALLWDGACLPDAQIRVPPAMLKPARSGRGGHRYRQDQDAPAAHRTALGAGRARVHDLPEVGDVDRPKLVFFFDEAHLLFFGASREFLEAITRTVRLIRSKGVGVFFVTRTPKDVPSDVLAQLGNRVQHALRAPESLMGPVETAALDRAVASSPLYGR
ncbi:hypothetical protein ADL00_19150 [Streptomyces sp. AS58]|nr:hypothetical protein ADL00_19150 [Streptomyces sp. AS58]